MRLLEALSTQGPLDALGWALVHSLWQGALVAAALAAALRLLRGRSSNARYAASCAALALMLLAPAATALGGFVVRSEPAASFTPTAARGAAPAQDDAATSAEEREGANVSASASAERRARPLAESVEGVLPWLSLLWAAGVLVLSARTAGGLAFARRLSREGARPASGELQERFAGVARRLRVSRPVLLLESSLVEVPTALGWLKPVVLLPASALTGLAPRQLEVILAHELAHIRRHDYLANLLQTFAETLLFYHPAAWWVSRQVRVEREHVCDDMAVGSCGGDALAYARALTQMERLRAPRLAMAASGGGLRGRVLRLVGAPQPARAASPLVAACLFLCALLATVACTRAALSGNPGGGVPANAPAAAAATPAADKGSKKATIAVNPKMPREVAALIESDDTTGEDMEVRRAAVEALGPRAGTVVVMDAKTGRVYTVVNQEWAVRRGWLPASTTKVVVSLAAVGGRVFDPSERVKVSDRPGPIDMTDAIALSNNPYFVSLSERVGAEAIISYARRLGYGEETGVNIEGEARGNLPAASGVKAVGPLGAHGEGMAVTPMQLAVVYAALGNGGQVLVPRVPRTPEEAARFEPRVRRSLDIPREVVGAVLPGLVAAVERGTGSEAKAAGVKVAGKTGSATIGDSGHGIFASYAPADDPRLVVVVFTRGKGENGRKAAGIAASIYKSLGSRL